MKLDICWKGSVTDLVTDLALGLDHAQLRSLVQEIRDRCFPGEPSLLNVQHPQYLQVLADRDRAEQSAKHWEKKAVQFEHERGFHKNEVDHYRAEHEKLVTQGAQLMAENAELRKPVPLILVCPECGERHIDGPTIPPHRTHACQHCGMLWAPAVVPTTGVQFLPGCKDQP